MSSEIHITILCPEDSSLGAENKMIREEVENLFRLKNFGDYKEVISFEDVRYDNVEEVIRPYLCDVNPVIVYGDELARRIAGVVATFAFACDTNANKIKLPPILFIAAGEIKDLSLSPYLYRFCYSGDRYAKWLSLTKDVKENLCQQSVGFIVVKDDSFAMSMYDDIVRYFKRQHINVELESCDFADGEDGVHIDVERLSNQYSALYVSGFGDNMKKLMSCLNGYAGVVYTDSAFAVTFDWQKKPNFSVYFLMPTEVRKENFRKYFAYFVSAAVLYLLENQDVGSNNVTEMSRLISTVYEKNEHRLGDVLIQDGGDLIFEQALWCWDPQKLNPGVQEKGDFQEKYKVGLCDSVSWSTLKGHKLAAQLQGLDNIINGIDVRISAEGEITGVDDASFKIAHQIATGFGSECLALYLNNLKVHSTDRLLYESDDNGKKINIGWLVAAFSGLRLNDPIQLSLAYDSEDNNTYQIYIVIDSGVVPISAWEPHRSENSSFLHCIIIAKTEENAQAISRVESGRMDSSICEDEFFWKPILGGWVCLCKHDRSFNFLVKLKAFLFNNNVPAYYYLVPDIVQDLHSDEHSSWMLIKSVKLDYLKLRLLINVVTRFFSIINGSIHGQLLRISNTKSAIGSIMSRNGSHNIGSHVLAALSHNVGTMPDDRVLYQYIQQRMDYIATATTERPLWRQPVTFVAGVMRQFLIQRHLLDHISGSEGLHAYQFQNRAVLPDQKETIRIHVRRIQVDGDGSDRSWESNGFLKKDSPVSNFIIYPEDEKPSADELERIFREEDLSVALPGGIVGSHAFYTIIENVLRNAAKHEWSRLDKEKQKNRSLELYIDFRDNPDKGLVECRIWNDKASDPTENETEDIEKILKSIERKIKTSFIEEDGRLRKENWGIAEMRISAGYLKLSDIADIGGIESNPDDESADNKTLKIIRPVLVENRGGRKCLGYRFDLYKPRELLVVVPNGIEVPQEAQKNAKQHGVWFMTDDAASKEKALPYSYVLFDAFSCRESAQGGYKLPFRVLATHRPDIGSDDLGEEKILSQRLVAKYSGDFYRNSADIIRRIADNDGVSDICYKLLGEVYADWLMHIRKQRQEISANAEELHLVIDVDRDSGRGKKSLVTQTDLARFVFEHSFNSAARAFKKIQNASEDKDFWSVLDAIVKMSPRKVCSRDELYLLAKGDRKYDIIFTINDMVRMQLLVWCQSLKNGNDVLRSFALSEHFTSFINYLCGPIIEQANAFLAKYEETYVTLPDYFSSEKKDAGSTTESDEDASCSTTESDEDSSCSTGDEGNVYEEYEWDDTCKIIITNDEDIRNENINKGAFCYLRHREEKREYINEGYLEPLSGAQSSMNAMLSFAEDVKRLKEGEEIQGNHGDPRLKNKVMRFATGLMENAMLRVLIIDERVKKFMDDHVEVRDLLNGLGIAVCDHKDDVAIKMLSGDINLLNEALELRLSPEVKDKSDEEPESKDTKGPKIKDFEIVVIHQGIIDKLLEGHEDKENVRALLKSLIARMRYVVITTGRGTPSNIPEDARILPYSVIENVLLKRYPEKMILVDTIMNVLPVGKKV